MEEHETSELKKFRLFFFKWIPTHFFSILQLRYLMAIRNKKSLIYRFVAPLPLLIFSVLLPKLIIYINDLNPDVILFLSIFYFLKKL